MLKYERIASKGRQRLYKFNKDISKSSNGVPIVLGKTSYVVVSDAATHLERLAFPAIPVNCVTQDQIVEVFEKHGAKPTTRTFKNEDHYGLPYVEIDYGHIAGNMSWMTIPSWNDNLLMSDEELLDAIKDANK